MFAYVKYVDEGEKEIVNIKDIKDFHPKNNEDYNSTIVYQVLWKNNY